MKQKQFVIVDVDFAQYFESTNGAGPEKWADEFKHAQKFTTRRAAQQVMTRLELEDCQIIGV